MSVVSYASIAILVAAAIYFLLDLREKSRVAKGLPRLASWRLVFASFALLIILFSGGCGGMFMLLWVADGMKANDYVGWQMISILSLPPLAVGALIWWLSMRRKSG